MKIRVNKSIFNKLSLRIYLLTWGVSILTYFLNLLIDPDTILLPISKGVDWIGSIFYIIFCVVLLGVGIIWEHSSNYTKRNLDKLDLNLAPESLLVKQLGFRFSRVSMYTIAVLLFISGLLVFRYTGFSGSLEDQRQAHIDSLGQQSGGFDIYLYQYSSPFAFILLSLIPWIKNIRFFEKLVAVALIGTGHLMSSLTSGSRSQLLVSFLLPFLISLFLRVNYASTTNLRESRVKSKSRKLFRNITFSLILFAIISSLIFLLLYWQYQRSASMFERMSSIYYIDASNYRNHYYFIKNLGFASDISFYIAFGLKNSLGYFSDGWVNFPYFFDAYDSDPLLGAYQLRTLFSLLFNFDWFKWKVEEVESVYKSFNLVYFNVWGTFLREYIIDFGFFLSPLISLVTGRLIAISEKFYLNSKVWLSLYVSSLAWLLFTPFYSLLLLRVFHTALLLIIAWLITSLFLKRP
jgi:hypothetical protein